MVYSKIIIEILKEKGHNIKKLNQKDDSKNVNSDCFQSLLIEYFNCTIFITCKVFQKYFYLTPKQYKYTNTWPLPLPAHLPDVKSVGTPKTIGLCWDIPDEETFHACNMEGFKTVWPLLICWQCLTDIYMTWKPSKLFDTCS